MREHVKLIGFDAWGTLIDFKKVDARHLRQPLIDVLTPFGVTADQFHAVYGPTKEVAERLSELSGNHIGPLERATLLALHLGVNPTELPLEQLEAACQVFLDNMEELQIVALDPQLPASLATVKAQGYQVAVVSNLGMIRANFMRRIFQEIGLAPYLDFELYSDETGLCKPNPRLFRELCSRANCRPDEVLFIGDRADADYHGPRALGMQAVYVGKPDSSVEFSASDTTAALKLMGLLG